MQPTINKTKTKTLLIQNGDIRPVRVNWSCELTKDFNWQIVIYQCDPFKSSLSTSCWRCTSGNWQHCRSNSMFRLFYANTWRYLQWNFISKKNYWKGKQRSVHPNHLLHNNQSLTHPRCRTEHFKRSFFTSNVL